MGLLDSVVGALASSQAGGGAGGLDLMKIIAALIGPDGRGLAELVAKLREGGLGDAVQSWISTGANQAVSAEQLKSALGADRLAQLAQQAGMAPGSDIAEPLAQLLPQVVDKLTPQGELPAAGAPAPAAGLGELGSLVGSLLRR